MSFHENKESYMEQFRGRKMQLNTITKIKRTGEKKKNSCTYENV